MNVKLLVGIALFLLGIITAAIGIVGVGDGPATATIANESVAVQRGMSDVMIPVVAGLSLAVGGLLIGLSMGNWKNPRTKIEPGDKVVDPEGHTKMKHV